MSESLHIELRPEAGTTEARAVRRAGQVPGVIYGGKGDVVMFSIQHKQLSGLLHQAGFFNRVHTLDLNGKKEDVLAKKVQLHPVTDEPLHVEFMRVSKDSKIHVRVPLSFINEEKSPGLKRGGLLNIVVHTLELVCPPHLIPEKFVIDLSGLELHHTIHLDVLKLPEGAKAAHPERDHVLATIVAPSGGASEEA